MKSEMKILFSGVIAALFLLLNHGVLAQNSGKANELAVETHNQTKSTFQVNDNLVNNPFWDAEETYFKIGMRYTLLYGSPLLTCLFGINAWNWGENHEWRWGKERWFQADTDSGGADKIGHCYAHYVVARIGYSLFSYTEPTRERALIFSGISATLIGFIIEFGDAFTGRYGFSYEDLVSDVVGVGIAILLDGFPTLDAFIGFTGHYIPSEGFIKDKNKTVLNFAGDYSGWKYIFNFKFSGFHFLGYRLPEFLRFVQLDIGYYTRNYTEYDELVNRTDAKRYWFFGISVNLREVARDTFSFNRKASWLAEQPFKYYHVPIGYENAQNI